MTTKSRRRLGATQSRRLGASEAQAPEAQTLAWVTDMGKTLGRHEPKRANQRRYAEDCQYGDIVRWTTPPKVRAGLIEHDAPSCVAEVSYFLGPAPFTAFCRFFAGDSWEEERTVTEPMQLVRGQPLQVVRAR